MFQNADAWDKTSSGILSKTQFLFNSKPRILAENSDPCIKAQYFNLNHALLFYEIRTSLVMVRVA